MKIFHFLIKLSFLMNFHIVLVSGDQIPDWIINDKSELNKIESICILSGTPIKEGESCIVPMLKSVSKELKNFNKISVIGYDEILDKSENIFLDIPEPSFMQYRKDEIKLNNTIANEINVKFNVDAALIIWIPKCGLKSSIDKAILQIFSTKDGHSIARILIYGPRKARCYNLKYGVFVIAAVAVASLLNEIN